MTDKETNIWPVIVRYLDGNLTTKEAEELEEWLDQSAENRRILHSVDQIWKASDTNPQTSVFEELNLEKDWEKVSRKIQSGDSSDQKARTEHFRKMRQRHKITSYLVKAAALILVAITSGFLTLQYAPVDQDVEYEPAFREITTNPGERASIDLGDGTKVSLNIDSKLVIPDKFSQSDRVVKLTGQAFFDVETDADRPFFIETQNARIKVLGTSFDVRSYENENNIQVAVREGTVSFSGESGKEEPLILNEGFVGRMDVPNNTFTTEKVQNISSYFGWLNGRLIFKEKPLKNVLRDISRWYDIEVNLNLEDKSVLENTLTADLKTRSVRDVMDVIAMSMNIRYEVNDDVVTITN